MKNREEYSGGEFPNYISYSGSKFRILGIVRLDSYDPAILNQDISFVIGIRYQYRGGYNNYSYEVKPTWKRMIEIPISNIISDGYVEIDEEITIPGNYFRCLKPWLSFSSNTLSWLQLRFDP